jgi:CDP-diacylglycerol--glycerol-3-phosphate 3-phosphatidyltransferase
VHDVDLSRAKKYPDAWWTVVAIDPLAMLVLPHLVNRPKVTPNRISLVSFGFAVLALLAFLDERLILGAILFELRFFTDCLDGNLARIRGTSSERGAFIDNTCDLVGTAGCYAAVGYVAFDNTSYAGIGLLAALLHVTYTWSTLQRSRLGALDPERPRAGGSQVGRRFVPLPYGVEVETLTLFLLPLTTSLTAMRVGLWVAVTFYAVASLRNLRMTFTSLET